MSQRDRAAKAVGYVPYGTYYQTNIPAWTLLDESVARVEEQIDSSGVAPFTVIVFSNGLRVPALQFSKTAKFNGRPELRAKAAAFCEKYFGGPYASIDWPSEA